MQRFLSPPLVAAALLWPTPASAQNSGSEPSNGGAPEAEVPEAPADDERAPRVRGEFSFGSYGRVVGASNLRGGGGRASNVVSHGPRLEEGPYLELDLRYDLEHVNGARFSVVTTTAITDAMFHLDGDFDGAIALRNAYVQASDFGVDGLSAWAGSRMLRGDDIYLFDLWPLDNLNTVGGGLRYEVTPTTYVSAHGGVNQLDDPFQRQEVIVAGPQFDTESRIQLDRLRALGSLRFEQQFRDISGTDLGLKFVLYGDLQRLGAGVYQNEDDVEIALPSDIGVTVGAQVGLWGFARNGFANLFLRHSTGLAAYGELSVPFGTDNDLRVTSARLTRLALSANAESRWIGATFGAYVQWFRDADDVTFDNDDFVEGVFSVRPVIFLSDHVHQAFEMSYQRRTPSGLSARTDTYLEPAMWKFAVMPTISMDRAIYARPQIRLIYSASILNEGAQDAYPESDPRHTQRAQHFLGIGAEWWFNSSTYQ